MIKIIKKDVKNNLYNGKETLWGYFSSPHVRSHSYIEKFLKDKSSWIEEKLDTFKFPKYKREFL